MYVYNTSGTLQGSWAAGTLSSTATVEGIATNGTDVWIVDAKSDKVYRYTGAASRLSGSQTAYSSFNLNSGNTSPKDIVTDGTSLWVINDSTTDKVFKYSVAGSLRQLDNQLRRRESDRDHAGSRECQQSVDSRQRHRSRLSVRCCRHPHIGFAKRRP